MALTAIILLSLLARVDVQNRAHSSGTAVPASLPLAAVNGPQETIVILVQFQGTQNTTSPSRIQTLLSGLNDYYNENSYGTVSFQTDITPASTSSWYSMPHSMAYYGADTASSDNELVHDALKAVYDAGANLASYKFAIVLHAGDDEAISRVSADIHSYTIPGYVFSPLPLTSYKISTSVVAETDPKGVFSHESGHLLGLPDLYDITRQVDPTNNFIGYWELMALGEWNPNNGNPTQAGTYPAHMSSWSKIELGFVASTGIVTVQSGESRNITIENLEQATAGSQAVKIPVAYNSDGSLTYYLLEMRAKLGTYDQYLPFPSFYPNAGLLIYEVNESIPNGSGSVRLIDAHPGGDLNDAPFGPCAAPCVSNNVFSDQANYVKVIVTATTPTAYAVTVDRTNSPVFLLQVNTPSQGVLISVDDVNMTSDASKQLRLPVRYGPHTVFVQLQIPLSVGSTTIEIGLTNAFAFWDDGGTANPRGISVVKDTVLTAIYRIAIAPSFSAALAALIILCIVVVAASFYRRKSRAIPAEGPQGPQPSQPSFPKAGPQESSFPGNDGLPGGSVEDHEEPQDP